MVPIHPGRVLRRELKARRLSANALARALRVPSGRVVDTLDALRAAIRDAVACHYDDAKRPKVIRLR